MNIWVEYFRYEDTRNNTWAQMKENAKWVEPDPKKVMKRFFQDIQTAQKFCARMNEQGYHTKIKRDGAGV